MKKSTFKQNSKSKIALSILIIGFLFLSSTVAFAVPSAVKSGQSCKSLRVSARVYMAHGDYVKALPVAERALSLAYERQETDKELYLCLSDLSCVYNYLGKYDKAEHMCKLALRFQEKIYSSDHPYVAYTLRTLCSIYQGQGNMEQAETVLRRAITIMQTANSSEDPILASFYVDYAKLEMAKGDYERSESYYKRALTSIYDRYGKDHLMTATVETSLAELYANMGNYDRAEVLINKSCAIQERVYGKDSQLVAAAWLIKAKILQAKGQSEQAEGLIGKASAVVRKSGNSVQIAKLTKNIEDIRAIGTYGPVVSMMNP